MCPLCSWASNESMSGWRDDAPVVMGTECSRLHPTARVQTRREASAGFCTGLDRRAQADLERSRRVGFAPDARRCSSAARGMESNHSSGDQSRSGNRSTEEGGASSAQHDRERPGRQADSARRSGRQPDRAVGARGKAIADPCQHVRHQVAAFHISRLSAMKLPMIASTAPSAAVGVQVKPSKNVDSSTAMTGVATPT